MSKEKPEVGDVRGSRTYEEISVDCAKHALDFLHYITSFHNLYPDQIYEVRKFIHIINGYNKALKNYKKEKVSEEKPEVRDAYCRLTREN